MTVADPAEDRPAAFDPDVPNLLALDTCLGACSVAVAAGGRLLSRCEPMTRGHQERLGGMALAVMAQAGLPFSALRRIGVTVGPGSFTGLRVGLAFAKGLSLALGLPCVGVGALEALASAPDDPGPRAAVIDAGRGHVFLQVFVAGRAVTAPDSLPLETAAARLVELGGLGAFTLVGPGAPLLAGVLPDATLLEQAAPSPANLARLVALAADVPARPLYLRAPDAKPKGG